MSTPYRPALERLAVVPGVRGAMIVDVDAGLPVVAALEDEGTARAVAALSASLIRRTEQAVLAADLGSVELLQLDGGDGRVVLAAAGEVAVVAIAERGAQLGPVRVAVRQAVKALG